LNKDVLCLIAIYDKGSREATITALEEMKSVLTPDEKELAKNTVSAIQKLKAMTDTEYESLDLFYEFK